MGWRCVGAQAVLALGLAACDRGEPKEPTAPPVEVAAEAPAPEVAETEPSTPAGVDLVLYVNSPASLLSHAAEFYGDGPFAPLLASDGLLQFLPEFQGARFADLSAPLQVAALEVVDGEETLVAVSFGLRPGYAESELDQAFEVSRRLPDLEAAKADRPSCYQHTTADNRERLICAEHPKTVRRLAGYMKKSALRRFAADVRLEFTRQLIEKSAKAALDEATPDDAQSQSEAAGERVAHDLFDSLGATAVELTLSKASIALALDVELTPDDSFLNTLLVGTPASPAPPSFDKLPLDTGFAFTSAGIEPGLMARAARAIWRALEADLRSELPGAQVDRGMPLLTSSVFTGGSLRFAYGAPQNPKQKEPSDGWWCVGLVEPLDLWTSKVRTAIEIDRGKFALAPGETEKKKTPEKTRVRLSEKPMATGRLPKGSLHLVVKNAANPDYRLSKHEAPAAETTIHVYFTTDGAQTWVVGSTDNELALARAKHFVEVQGRSKVADYFRAGDYPNARVLGFVTPRGIAHALDDEMPDSGALVLERLPEQGNAPIHFAYTVDGQGTKHARAVVEFDRQLVLSSIEALLSMGAAEIPQP